MRISSSFRDYYDSVQAHGQDQTLVYVRRPEQIEIVQRRPEWLSFVEARYTQLHPMIPNLDTFRVPRAANWSEFRGGNDHTVYRMPFIIGFCGKWYPGVRFETVQHGPPDSTRTTHVVYNETEYDAFMAQWKTEPPKKYWSRYVRHKKPERPSFFCLAETDCTKVLVDHKTPIITISGSPTFNETTKNDQLQAYAFAKVFDPYTAYQEIDMFLSGVIGMDAPPTVEVSDITMVRKKGFDPKYGFRKRKEV